MHTFLKDFFNSFCLQGLQKFIADTAIQVSIKYLKPAGIAGK